MRARSKKSDLKPEYDFATMPGGVRGKYAKAYRDGTNIAVLADDVASAFPTDDSVNRALRAIIVATEAMPRNRKPSNKAVQLPAAKRRRRAAPRQRRSGSR